MEPFVKVRNLQVIYQKDTPLEIEALKGVNIEVYPEEFLLIYGPSGCGKSTLLYSISGIEEEISGGEIWYKNKNVREMSRDEFIIYHRQAIGMIFQGYQLIPTLNVLNNITLPLVFEGIPRMERKRRGAEILEHFGIKDLEKNLPNDLSGGQQQRVGIARALINDPEIILADEPTGNLDSAAAVNVLDTLKELTKTMKKTIVLVTHEAQYFPYATRIVFMKDGLVVNEVRQDSKGESVADSAAKPQENNKQQKDMRLQAVKIINFLGLGTGTEEYSRIEGAIGDFFERKINSKQLYNILHNPIQNSGIGLYKQKSSRLTDQVEEVLELMDLIRGVKNDNEKIANIKISYVTDWLLKVFHGHLGELQKTKLVSTVEERIKGKISHAQMQELLDMPEPQGGLGLSSHTARNISQRLEVVLG